MPLQVASSISGAVGKEPAPNRKPDQEIVIDLLSRVSPNDGGRSDLPPATSGGVADIRLVNAITQFQLVMAARGLLRKQFVDGRVDRAGTTLRLLNQFAGDRRGGGGGLVIPNDPPPPTPPPAPAGPGFLRSLFTKLTPRPTNLQIAGSGTVSGSLSEIGLAAGRMQIEDITVGPPFFKMKFAGAGLSLGPLPFGLEVAPSSFPSRGSRIHAGPRTPSTRLAFEDLLGICLFVGASVVADPIPAGSNATVVLFGIGRNRTTNPKDVLEDAVTALGSNKAIAFLDDSFRTCKAWGSTFGVFAGMSLGVILVEALMVEDGGFIRPDPDVRRFASFRR